MPMKMPLMVGKRSRVPSPVELDRRRAAERNFVKSYDTSETDIWFLIDSNWLAEWKSFVSSTCTGPVPGPINNHALLTPGSRKPKRGLQPGVHYCGVNAAVWAYLHQQYGGGPVLCRSTIDLYAPSCTELSAAEPLLARSMDDMDEFPAAESEKGSSTRGLAHGLSSKFLRMAGSVIGKPKWANATRTLETDMGISQSSPHKSGMVFFVKQGDAEVTPQPGDGSCLFHSMSAGLGDGTSASLLRLEISKYILDHPNLLVAGTSLDDWVKHDGGEGISTYATRMAGGSWGGGIEMEVLTKLRDVNVHVFEKCRDGFQRISCFDAPDASQKRTVNVLYQGRNHYDALSFVCQAGEWTSGTSPESRL